MLRSLTLALSLAATTVAAQEVSSASGGIVRVLDKVTAITTDLELSEGASGTVGHLTVQLNECRYPADNPLSDAFGELVIHYRDDAQPVFNGWMIASAPALNAMDHPRYDVWMLRCITS